MPRDRREHGEADQSLREAYEQLQLRFRAQAAELRAAQEALRRHIESGAQGEEALTQCGAGVRATAEQHDREASRTATPMEHEADQHVPDVLHGITDRQRTCETLSDAKEQWERTFDCVPDMVIVVDDQHRVVDANRAMVEAFGISREMCEGEICHHLMHDTDVPPAWCLMSLVFADGQQHSAEVRCERLGRVFFVTCTPRYDLDGRFTGAVHVARDITERKRVEDALRISEENFRQFFDRIDAYLFVLDLDGCIQHINGTVTAKLGYEPADLLGKSVLRVHPESRQDEAARIVGNMVSGEAATCPLPLVAKDGRLVPVETRVARGKWNGQDALLGFSKDLSALWASEERFAKSFHCNPSPMALTSLTTGSILDVNQAFLETLGFERAGIIGRETRPLFVDPARRSAAMQIVKNTGRLRDFEAEVRTKNGQVRHGVFAGEVLDLQDDRVLLTVMHDITDRVRAQEALDRMTERFLRATTAANVGIWEHDLPSSRVVWSDAMFRLYGMAPQDFCGTIEAWHSGVHPEDLPRVRAGIDLALKSHLEVDTEFRVVWPDASVHWIKARATVLRDAFGNPYRLLGTNWDITDLKRTEEELRRSKERYRTVVEDQTEVISRFTQDGTLTFVNEVCCRYFNKTRQELLGSKWQPTAVADDLPLIERQLSELASENPIVVVENRVLDGMGRTRWMQFVNRGFFDDGGRLVEIQSVGRDISERKEVEAALSVSENRYRVFIETIPQIAWQSSADGRHVDYNRRWYEYTGLTTEEGQGEGWLAVVHPEDLDRVKQRLQQAVNAQLPCEFEYRLRRASDRAYRWHLVRALPTVDEAGNVTSWIGSATDIEELKQAQEILRLAHDEQLQRHQAELAHVARLSMMGELTASLAHELIQPLHAVKNYAYGASCRLRRSADRDAEQEMVLEQISVEADRAAEIIRRIRRFVEKRAIQFSDLCVNGVIRDAVLLAKMTLERYRARIDLDLAVDLPTVVGDPIQIEQVVMNLVLNALEGMDDLPDDSRQLGITTLRCGDGIVQVDVCDSGVGIRDADLERVFEPFFTTKLEGMGMGLAICRSIVHAHGGRLWVTRNRTQGCTFHFTLPVGGES